MKKILVFIMIALMVTTGCTDVLTVEGVVSDAIITPEPTGVQGGESQDIRDDSTQPSLDGQTPTKDDSKQLPLEGEQPPKDENEQAPVDGERPPRGEDEQAPAEGERPPRGEDEQAPAEGERPPKSGDEKGANAYSIDQAISDNAQLTTIAFSGLAYLTGTEGADAFFPPGKVADFFGFQYMRDVDVSGYGHNTTFLTKVASNMLYIFTDEQIDLLKDLAMEQETLYEAYGYGRLNIIDAFRREYENDETLDLEGITDYSADLYEIDGQLSYHRAEVFGEIINLLTDEQMDYINQMAFNDSSTWPEVDEAGLLDKRSMSHLSHVAVMTYASEFFSWYAGSVEADVYFCPERHGTYFGGFYMKDYPAMGDPDYFISTSITGNSGREFLEILDEQQQLLITSIVEEQRAALNRIVEVRREVVSLLRDFTEGKTVDESAVMALMREYGALEGQMSYLYATRFSEVGETLSDEQAAQLYALRNQYVFPDGSYLYSAPIEMPSFLDSDSLIQ